MTAAPGNGSANHGSHSNTAGATAGGTAAAAGHGQQQQQQQPLLQPKRLAAQVWLQHRERVQFIAQQTVIGAAMWLAVWVASRKLCELAAVLVPDGDLWILGLGWTFWIHQVVFWAVNAFFVWVDLAKPPSIYQYKIQSKEEVTWAVVWKCTKRCLFNQWFVLLPMTAMSIPVLQARGLQTDVESMPGLMDAGIQFALLSLIYEFFFFYAHYVSHWRRIYKYVHKVHHEFTAPISMSSEYAHVLEMISANVWPMMAGVLILGVHLQMMWFFMIVGLLSTANAHCGYRLPWSPYVDTMKHDYHHSAQKDNYGALGLLDWLHNTDRAYNKHVAHMEHMAATQARQQ